MITRSAVAAIVPLLLPICSYADDADKPDPREVIDAQTAAQRARNVDAILALWDDDGVVETVTGGKFAGKEKLRSLFTDYIKRRVESHNDFSNSIVKDNTVILHTMGSSSYLVELGVAPITVNSLTVVDGNRIKSRIFYYPLKSVDRVDQACRSPEKQDVLISNQPCSDFVHKIRTHTENLIADGVVDKED